MQCHSLASDRSKQYKKPINEFSCDGYICRAFPTLFPTRRVDLKDARVRKITPK